MPSVRQDQLLLEELLREMPKRFKLPFRMRIMEGQSLRAIGKVMDKSPVAVGKLVFESKCWMHTYLQDRYLS